MALDSSFAMMDPPPVDRALDLERVRRVVDSAFPDLSADSIRRLGSGWEHDVYLVSEEIVLRFPRYAEVARNLDYDARIHELVRDHTQGTFEVPRIRGIMRSDAFPHRFVAQQHIPGVGVDHTGAKLEASLGGQLGRALDAVHRIPIDVARSMGVPSTQQNCGEALDALIRQLPAVPKLADLVPFATEWLQGLSDVPSQNLGPHRVIHGDLHGEHIIVDSETAGLRGLIDWSGIAIGDPTIDFEFLLLLGGSDFLGAALDHYPLPTDESFFERVVFRARVRSLGWLADALRRGSDTSRALREVGYAFEGVAGG